ncbi:MAG TPA: inositol monophosphatase [Pseudonocardiaceae bacterium]|jgi:fructose-1,6-bisphosphatase/inositol monophosphatase family enzyme|nr:inositol monophosphatase [Pseudonocardiaceae bacterium]
MTAEYVSFAVELARHSGDIILANFEKIRDVAVKPDGSPVTSVDQRINREVAERIIERYPRHAVLGEEGHYGDGTESHRWICDPLDGTAAYILGLPNSVFMLALMVDDELAVSVVLDPFVNRLYRAVRGAGAWCDNRTIQVSHQTLRDGYVVLGSDGYPFASGLRQAGAQVEAVPGTGYKSMMVASGRAVGLVKSSADFHDIAPAALIVREAGGKVTSLDGSPLVLDRPIGGGVIVSNSTAHPELVAIAARAGHAEVER